MSDIALGAVASGPHRRIVPDIRLTGGWFHRLRTRRALARLHPDQIREAGIDPYFLREEILKPVWRA